MNILEKTIVFLLVLVLAVSCLPLGAIMAFATETEETLPPADASSVPNETEEIIEVPTEETELITESTEETQADETIPEVTEAEITDPLLYSVSPLAEGGSSGSETGDADSGGNAAGEGTNNMVAAGVTMQVVYYRYDQCYNRYNSHACVIDTVKNGKAIPWNSTGRDTGTTKTTVFDT